MKNWLIGLVCFLVSTIASAACTSGQTCSAVATYENVGLYYTPGSNPGAAGCPVQYKKTSDTIWKDALPMWYDSRNSECRGSVVQLTSGTSYDFRMGVTAGSWPAAITVSTWTDTPTIASTTTITDRTTTLNITSGGSAGTGYALYQGPATINVNNAAQYDINVSASYVIIRGLTLKGATIHAINLQDGVHDVIIEGNDISGWGRPASDPVYNDPYVPTASVGYGRSVGYTVGWEMDSGVYMRCTSTTASNKIVVQRNLFHDPRYGSNSWTDGHPNGPQAVTLYTCGGNNVYRYNKIIPTTSSSASAAYGHWYNDPLGGAYNNATAGWPNFDSDVYGNWIEGAMDDCIEADGGNKNVRIYGNYCNNSGTGVSVSGTNVGPVYIFRNVYNRNFYQEALAPDSSERQEYAKAGIYGSAGNGRRYIFHNTTLQATATDYAYPTNPAHTYPLGTAQGIARVSSGLIENTVSRNNIWHGYRGTSNSVFYGTDAATCDFDYDLYSGNQTVTGQETHGVAGTPIYAASNGWVSEAGGQYQLATTSPGYNVGVVIPNFNDGYLGTAPDMGAAETGSAYMQFGVNAYLTQPDPPPPPPLEVSPEGTAVPPATQIIDANLATWTVTAGQVYKDSVLAGTTSNVALLYYHSSVVYYKNSSNAWFSWSGTAWVSASDPNPPPPTTSAEGTSIPNATEIVDTNHDIWTVSAGVVYKNGAAAGTTSATILLYWHNSLVFRENSSSSWWYWNTSTSTWAPTTSPLPTPLIESTEGTAVPPSTSIVDANLAVWAVSAGVVYKDNIAAGATSNVSLLYYHNHTVYYENSSNSWWYWSGATWTSTTDPIPAPPPTTSPDPTASPPDTQIVDTNGDIWTLSAGVVYKNSVAAGFTSGVVLIYWHLGTIYQENAAAAWWSWNGADWIDATSPLPPPPPPPAASPNDTALPPVTSIVDSSGNTWTVVAGQVYMNGSTAGVTANVILLYWHDGVIYQENASAEWWSWSGTDWVTATSPIPPTTSPNQSAIPPNTYLVDANHDIWTLSAGAVYKNGVAAGYTAGVIAVYYTSSTIYQENDQNLWWSWSGTDWVDATNPVPPVAPPEVSANDAKIPPLTQIVDNNRDVWTRQYYAVYKNGLPAAYSSDVAEILWHNGFIYYTNSSASWWYWSGTAWVTATNPIPNDPPPPPAYTPSPAGTTIPPSASIIDTAGNVWTVSSGAIYKNGIAAGYSANATVVYWDASTLYYENNIGGWYVWNGTAWTTSTSPIPLSASADGTSIPSATEIIDTFGNIWMVVGGAAYKNGAPAGSTPNLTQLYYHNSTVYFEDSDSAWKYWNGTAWVLTTSPIPVAPSTSADDTAVPPSANIVDGGSNVWTLVAGVVYKNGVQAGYSANVVQLYWKTNVVYHKTSTGVWRSWNGSTWVTATDPTTPPLPPAATVGTPRRPVVSATFTGYAVPVPAVIEAESFNNGGEGVGYHDTTATNTGGAYRTSEGVDIIKSCDQAGGKYVVNNFRSGEWMNYSIIISTAASYSIEVKASNKSNTPTFHIDVDGVDATGAISVPDTGNWCRFSWVGKHGLNLTTGSHVLTIHSDADTFNLNQIRVTQP